MNKNQNIKTNSIVVIACGALMVFISMGTRQSFGLFLQPITLDLSVGRETFSLAMAWQNLLFGLPLIGILADRFGSRMVAFSGGLLYAAGFLLLSMTGSPTGLYLNLGVIAGTAIGCTSYVVVLGAAARVVPPEKRSSSFGIITAAGSFGMFAVVPGIQWLIASVGWQTAFAVLAAFVGITAILAIGFPGKTAVSGNNPPCARPGTPALRLSVVDGRIFRVRLSCGIYCHPSAGLSGGQIRVQNGRRNRPGHDRAL